MTNILTFKKKKEHEPLPGPFTCSLNRALLTVQYCVMVLEDLDTARDILHLVSLNESLDRVTLPGHLRDAVENTDTAATYRAVLGVGKDE